MPDPKAVTNLKDRPKDEKTAVASGIAITVIIVLFIIWGFYFFHKVRSGAVAPTFQGAGQQFNASGLQAAQQQLQTEYASATSQFQNLSNEAAQSQVGVQQSEMQIQAAGGGTDQFGNPTTGQ